MVLITQATSEDSGEPAHSRSLARAFAVRIHEVWKKMKSPTKSQTSSPTGWQGMHVWRMSLRMTKSAIISWAGSFYDHLHKSYVAGLGLDLATPSMKSACVNWCAANCASGHGIDCLWQRGYSNKAYILPSCPWLQSPNFQTGPNFSQFGWLVVLRLNVPVNNFSVMSGRSHRFLGN